MSTGLPQPKRLLLIDHDDVMRRTLAEQLAAHGFQVTQARSSGEALALLEGPPADLLLVEAMLPDGAAPACCRSVRDAGWRGPLLVLGLPVEGLAAARAAGASDCIAKPYRLSALTQRLTALLREPAAEGPLVAGFRFHAQARLLTDAAGVSIRLTEKEAAIIAYLLQAAPRVVPRDELLGEVWGYAGGADTHTVETHIYRLRRKLGAAAPLLVTDAGGYRLELAG